MSNVNIIPSTQVAAGSQGAQQQALSGSQSGVLAQTGSGMNFFDLIIARLASMTEGEKNSGNAGSSPVDGVTNAIQTHKAGGMENPLAALQLVLATQSVDENGNIIIPTSEGGTEKLQTQLDFTNQLINHLKAALPDSAEQQGIFSNLLAKLQAKSDTLQTSLSVLENGMIAKDTPVEDIPLPLLIAFGLKPSEIAEVGEKVKELEEKLGREITVEDLIAGVGGLIPPASETVVVAATFQQSPKAVASSPMDDVTMNLDENAEPTDDLAARLNALDVGGEETDAETDAQQPQQMKARPAKEDVPADAAKPAAADTDKKPALNIREHLVNLTNGMKSAQGEMIFPLTMFDGDVNASLFQSYGLQPSAALSLGTTAQAANMVATSAYAGSSHPATQAVAAQIVRYADNGENQTFNLRLDPPELGNVNVRLQFGKDKTVTAHLTIEKPETYMMLSRDAHALERALQNAGLDTGSGNISFELASQDNPFNNNGEGGGEKNFGGGNAGTQDADAGIETIQSTVTWQIDPSTGHVRYNIFA